MSNIFNDVLESSVGERLSNIQDLSITQDSVVVLQTNNQSISRPISYYAQNTLLGLNSDADIQTIANNASPVGYSTIYTENISKLTQDDVVLNLKPIAENPIDTTETENHKSALSFWGTFGTFAHDGQPRAAAQIKSGFFGGSNWGNQKLNFYVGNVSYDSVPSGYPGLNDTSLRFQIGHSQITTSVDIRPNADNTIDLGYDSNNVTPGVATAGDSGDLWFQNSFIRNMYYQNLYEASDQRLKTDINPIPSALGSILKIQTKRYRYKNDPSKLRFGVIAQQIQTLFSDEYAIVNERENGMLSVNYKEFIPLIIKSIQELARNRSKNIPDDVNVVEVPREDPKDNNMFGGLMDRIMKLEKLFSAGANIVESVEEIVSSGGDDEKDNDILARLEKLENKHSHIDSDEESEGFDMVAKLQQELYESNQRISKIENKIKRMTTLINKLAKQS